MDIQTVTALIDTQGPDITGNVVDMPAGSTHYVTGKDARDFYANHPDTFTVSAAHNTVLDRHAAEHQELFSGAPESATYADVTTDDATLAAINQSVFSATIVDAFVYDTAKDSDGGAWRHRCSHTSWFNETLSGNWLGSAANETAARAISGATTGSYYYDTTAGAFYTLNAGSGKTATYRGNVAKFPAKVLITVEAARVVLWDLTQAGCPMWMVFVANISNAIYSASLSSVAMLNGVLVAGTGARAHLISFVDELMRAKSGTIAQTLAANIAARHSGAIAYNATSEPYLVNAVVNDVAMTVLPNAPVDVATGLPIPVIDVFTDAGTSRINSDGTVADLVDTAGDDHKAGCILASGDSVALNSTNGNVDIYKLSNTLADTLTPDRTYDQATVPALLEAVDAGDKVVAMKHRLAIGQDNGVNLLVENPASVAAGMVAYVTKDYNTGWMVGDIQAAICANSGNTITDRSVKAISTTSTTLATAAVASGTELLSFTDSGGNITATLGATIASGHHVHWEYVSGAWKQYISAVDGSGNSTANGYVDGVASAAVPITNVAVASGTGVTILQNITVANARFSVTAISAEQAAKLYRDELPLFQANAACTLAGSSNAVTALAYDEDTDLLHVGTSYGRSTFHGLELVESEATAVGSITALSAVGGVIAQGGATAVDVYVPAQNLREELARTEERAAGGIEFFNFTATASQTDFALEPGWEIMAVYQQGALKRETTSWTREFNGFYWTAVLGTGATVSDWVSIMARRTK